MKDEFIFPWQESLWHHLVQRYQNGQLPHALLFTGATGLGKLHFAESFARWALCSKNFFTENSSPQDLQEIKEPCGQCQGCQLMKAGTHPDFLKVVPEAEGKQIPIDTIRNVGNYLTLKSQFAPLQVVVIAPADAMNKFAANSLLKTLEEPTPGSLLILETSQPSRLLPTIRSRCQSIEFSIPERSQSLTWLSKQIPELVPSGPQSEMERLLALAVGAPLLARKYAQQDTLKSYQQLLGSFEKLAKNQADPVAEAKSWEAVGLAKSVKWIYFWVASMIRLKSGIERVDTKSEWLEPVLENLAQRVNTERLFKYLDKVTETSRFVNSQVNVQLTLEDLLISWREINA